MAAIRVPRFSGDAVRRARESLGWTRGQLSAQVGVSLTSVASWERGEGGPSVDALHKLAKALRVKPAALLTIPREEWGQTELRVIRGLEQQEVAAALHVSPATVSAVESTYSPLTEAMARQLGELYGVTAAEVDAAWKRDRERLTRTLGEADSPPV
jgi:transcriptional regulator with XRE-family HTH domain